MAEEKFIPPSDAIVEEEKFTPPNDALVEVKKNGEPSVSSTGTLNSGAIPSMDNLRPNEGEGDKKKGDLDEAFSSVIAKSQAGYINPDLEDFNKPQVDRQTAKGEIPVDDLVLRTNVLRKMRAASEQKAKELPGEVERLKTEGKNLISQYQAQPSAELEQSIRDKQQEYLAAEKAANRQALITEVYNRRLMETSDSIKKMANDQVPDGIYSAIEGKRKRY